MFSSNLQYCQPEFYKFSEDSVFLAKESSSLIKELFPKGTSIKGLDLCSGCGVVGIETLRRLENCSFFHFVELQVMFKDSFQENIDFFLDKTQKNKVKLYNSSVESFPKYSQKKYNLIVSNPPFFKEGKNRLGPDNRRNLCRFLVDLDFLNFLSFIYNYLDKNGVALFLGRENEIKEEIDVFLKKITKGFEIKKYKSIGPTSLFMARFLDK
jgi:tRNA1Val (adenine37-N6)-methyltransferase